MSLKSLDKTTGSVVPPNLLPSNCAEDKNQTYEFCEQPVIGLLQMTADNIDILTETLDGKNTFHGTQMVDFAHGGRPAEDNLATIPILKVKKLQVPDEQQQLFPHNLG